MRLKSLAPLFVFPLLLTACETMPRGPAPHPSAVNPEIDGKGAFATGKYRNLFAELGHSEAEIDAKLQKAFQQLFHGDPDSQTLYYEAGQNADGKLAYLSDIRNRDVRTEGMSYGMMIAVQMNKKEEFDALWNWCKTHLYYSDPTHPSYGFFAWSAQTSGRHNDPGPAPDGEEYYTMALYFAAHRWPGGKGIYDYKAQADRLLTDMLHRAPISRPGGRGGMRTGRAMFDTEAKMVRFVPGANHTDPSYHLPMFYELWARWGPEGDRAFWLEAAKVSRDLYYKVAHPETGLCPEQCSFEGVPSRGGSGQFQADAWRCASNWSVDWSWFAKDPRQQELSDRMQGFLASKGMDTYPVKMSLDGKTVIDGSHTMGLVATNAVASLAATNPRSREFVKALWEMPIPDGFDRYYSGCLYMMSMLHCSGQFRIW